MQAKIATTLRDRKRMLLEFSRLQATVIQTEIQRRTGVQSAPGNRGLRLSRRFLVEVGEEQKGTGADRQAHPLVR